MMYFRVDIANQTKTKQKTISINPDMSTKMIPHLFLCCADFEEGLYRPGED
jgi:hypothetical protein